MAKKKTLSEEKMEESVTKLQKLFVLIKRRSEVKDKLENDDSIKENKEEFESYLTKLCLRSSQLYILIEQFLNEGSHFKKAKFLYNGEDLQTRLRQDLLDLRANY